MKNSYKLGLAAVAASMALVGCGGSSDTSAAVGKAFYIDSAVEGVTFTCGTQKGTTDAAGTFTFDIGSGCTFSLGNVFLRDVNVDELVDGTEMHETNNVISAQLLGMDTDGDPSNGIAINADIVAALEEAGITKLPDTDTAVADLAEVQTLIEDNGGTYVTLEEAQAHLDETMTTALTGLLAGKTFYNVASENTGDTWIDKVVVNADATSVTATSVTDSTDTGTFDMVIEGDTIAFNNANEAFELIFIQEAADKLVFQKRDENGSVVEEDLMFFEQAAAQAYYDSLQQPTDTPAQTDPIAITEAMLAGKTFYSYEEDTNYDGVVLEEIYAKMTFSSGIVTRTEVINVYNNGVIVETINDTFELPYTITSDGKLKASVPAFDGDPAETAWITLLSENTDSWDILDEGDNYQDGTIDWSENTTWYLSKPAEYPASL